MDEERFVWLDRGISIYHDIDGAGCRSGRYGQCTGCGNIVTAGYGCAVDRRVVDGYGLERRVGETESEGRIFSSGITFRDAGIGGDKKKRFRLIVRDRDRRARRREDG